MNTCHWITARLPGSTELLPQPGAAGDPSKEGIRGAASPLHSFPNDCIHLPFCSAHLSSGGSSLPQDLLLFQPSYAPQEERICRLCFQEQAPDPLWNPSHRATDHGMETCITGFCSKAVPWNGLWVPYKQSAGMTGSSLFSFRRASTTSSASTSPSLGSAPSSHEGPRKTPSVSRIP